jgi:hypothetical protein
MAQHIAKHHVDINIEKTLIVFSHVEQPASVKEPPMNVLFLKYK